MVQILPPGRQKTPSFAQQVLGGFAEGIEPAMQHYQMQKQQQQQQQMMSQAGQELLGMDISRFDPDTQKALLVEGLKQQGKQGLLGQKQQFLDNILGGNQKQANQGQSDDFSPESQSLNPADLSDQDIAKITSVDPNVGRSLQHAKDVALREAREERNFEYKKQKDSPEFQRKEKLTAAQATEDVKYNKELQAAHKQHEIKSQSLENLERLNKKGVTGKPFEKLLEKAGLVNLTSEGRREFSADVKNLITDIRSILGGQFSNFEFQTILNAYPSADFSQEANESIIKNLKNFQDIRNQEFKIANKIKKENGGELPIDFQSRVNEQLQEYAQSKMEDLKRNTDEIIRAQYGVPAGNTLLVDPNGELLSVPNDEVEFLMQSGAQRP